MKEYKGVKYLGTTRAGSAFELLSGDKLLEDAVILVALKLSRGVVACQQQNVFSFELAV